VKRRHTKKGISFLLLLLLVISTFRNAHTRKLLGLLDDISGRTGSLHALLLEESPKQAPPHHHNRHGGHHRAAHTPAPSPAPSPSPFTAPPKSASPAAITIPISPSTPQPKAESNPAVEDAPAQPRHSWRNYGLVTAGSAVFLVMTIASVIYCRAKKVGTVRPWATGLSGQLQRAFVTGTRFLYMYILCVLYLVFQLHLTP
jgi:hypothetical protein